MENLKQAEIRTYTKGEICALYKISPQTFRRWLKKIVNDIPDYTTDTIFFNPKQVKFIFDKWGNP